MLSHYSKFWLNAKLKFILTSVVTLISATEVQAPIASLKAYKPSQPNPKANFAPVLGKKSIIYPADEPKSDQSSTLVSPPPPPSVTPCVPMDALPSQDQNYVVTFTPKIAVTNLNQLSCTSDVMENIQYSDGLGRTVQDIQVRGNNDASADMVQLHEYDMFGRESRKYLPFADDSYGSGSLRYFASSLAGNYYFNAPASHSGTTSTAYPVAETDYENSPLNRVVEQGAPGQDWQLSQGHTVKVSYDVNIANDVVLYTAEPEGADTEEYKRNLYANGYYDAGELYLTTVKNENWMSGDGKENTTEEYKDKDGRIVLKRTFDLGGAPLSTYYVYDYRGNLCFVLPPKENPDVTKNNITITMLDELCYQYYYDSKNRVVEKKVPGKGWEYMVYNTANKLVAYQDAIMNAYSNGPWKIIKYDNLDRVIITGVISSPYAYGHFYKYSRQELQDQVDQNSTIFETRSAGSDYTNVAWPNTVPITKLTVSYYDNYDIPNLPALYDHRSENSTLTKSQLTATITNVLNHTDILWTVDYYDDFGRITNVYAQHCAVGPGNVNLGNYDHIANTYNFDNQINSQTRQHYNVVGGSSAPLVTITNSYAYDHLGRKRQTKEKIDTHQTNNTNIQTTTGQEVILSLVDYSDSGQPITKHLHSEDGGNTFLQDVAFIYNERGWLKQTHSSLFDEQLRYNNQLFGASVNYNGNVAEEEVTTLNGNRHFTYTYDKLNRLTQGVSSGGNLSETDIHYDAGGNITQLKRNGSQLNYTYAANTNKLMSLSGLINSYGFAYDNNGNLNSDYRDDKFITEDFNMLNLPEYIGGVQDISLIYSATGEKLESQDNQTGETKDWIRGIEYNINWPSSEITSIRTEEGRAVPDGNGGFKYEYTLKDHLGSNRVNFDKDPSTSSARRIQETDYFPFGKSQAVYFFGGNKNEYLYNGKEHLELLNEEDYGARYYDAEVARWKGIDPLAEKSRRWNPYNYGYNNPISNIDPDGMEASRFNEDPDATLNANDNTAQIAENNEAATDDGKEEEKKKDDDIKGVVMKEVTVKAKPTQGGYPYTGIDRDQGLYLDHALWQVSSFMNSDQVGKIGSAVVTGTDAIGVSATKANVISKVLQGSAIESKAFKAFTHSGTVVGAIAGGAPALFHIISGNATWRDGASLGFALVGVAAEFTGIGEAYDGTVGLGIAAASLTYDIWDATHPAN